MGRDWSRYGFEHEPTDQQQAIIEAVLRGDSIKEVAYAGSAKTSTNVMVATVLQREGILPRKNSIGNICYNKSIQLEAEGKMPDNVHNKTAHSLAFGAHYKRRYPHKNVISSGYGVLRAVREENEKFQNMCYALGKTLFPDDRPKNGAFHAANLIMGTAQRFANGYGDYISDKYHIDSGVCTRLTILEAPAYFIDNVKKRVAQAAQELWEYAIDPNNDCPILHDFYIKDWVMTSPRLKYDMIMFDEAQDANPVMHKLVEIQSCQKVIVGDPYQQIYAWRGATDALDKFDLPTYRLTRSFRFGEVIAGNANEILQTLGETEPLIGASPHAGEVGAVFTPADKVTHICRTNIGVLKRVISYLDRGQRPYVVGGTETVAKYLEGAYKLYQGREPEHPDFNDFRSWEELLEYTDTSQGSGYVFVVRYVEEKGAEIERLVRRLRNDAATDPNRADGIVTTGHKSKGLEWDNVEINDDFRPFVTIDEGDARVILNKAEANLFYVVCTRAMRRLSFPASLNPRVQRLAYESREAIEERLESEHNLATALSAPRVTEGFTGTGVDPYEVLKLVNER